MNIYVYTTQRFSHTLLDCPEDRGSTTILHRNYCKFIPDRKAGIPENSIIHYTASHYEDTQVFVAV